ncbi:hypothetical protein [Bifidobacterium tibiigranuli]|uniref:hypothetical protein n=1 Tax=Bifidobacterium tibiigranuli TaxID=2172043 RepID=UPI0026F1FA50|nr:hypothetical protein [Bifidobacterium tibiigranuli]MCI1650663.1 hypothetical protein [Bifidobacterium tibiigranuli]MCI2185303.1 hypothetical protein [Bifidobacterium tibiigranuli]MCI2203722.1 hypothetical protein [Bifidobacterium tibiigranuli]
MCNFQRHRNEGIGHTGDDDYDDDDTNGSNGVSTARVQHAYAGAHAWNTTHWNTMHWSTQMHRKETAAE